MQIRSSAQSELANRTATVSKSNADTMAQRADNRGQQSIQMKTQEIANASSAISQLKLMQSVMQGKSEPVQRAEEEELLQGKFETVQRAEEEEPLQGKFETVQRAEDEELLQGKFEAVQRVEEEEPLQGKFNSVRK